MSILFRRYGLARGVDLRMLGVPLMKRRAGFTLLELSLAIFIAMLVLTAAVPSWIAISRQKRLRKTFDDFDAFVRKAQGLSVGNRRAYVMEWDEKGTSITLRPENVLAEGSGEDGGTFSPSEGEITIERPKALVKDPPAEWIFWRSGACEPVIIRYKGDPGEWEAAYDPLTAHGALRENVK